MSGRLRVAYLLTQDRGGPVDVTIRLASTLIESGLADVRVFGPTPARGVELLDGHHEEILVARKGDLAAGRRTRRVMRAWRPDVVHAQDRRAGLVSAGLRSSAVVHTYHGVPDDVGEPWFRGIPGATSPSVYTHAVLTADALVARAVHRTIVPAPAMGRFLADRLRVPAKRLAQIDNCVAATDVRPPSGPVRHLAFVGLLVARKGVLDLLTALAMPGVMPADGRLTVIGDGPQRQAAERLAAQPALAGKVEFLGFRSDVPDLLLGCDALVLPSSMEQQPLVLAEAMSAGKPVVATDTGGVADMVGASGYLSQPGDVRGLGERLRELFADPDPAGTGQELATRARARFTPEVCARRHLELYEAVLR
ncbi:glycosyltransferase family 4 protein [Umezawaea sp. Da 62-37]|uniref:glycosyltransferase family 4 protein n=1 Tax=Umezawaea sp. Da 62-37 TaxID=3075927 RepID=UPI0028F6DCF3|nr:glycosyltransferase family 4 protein [Umezawaea sp. Da 62-37]WNV88539.1 glycosyltransferase family 4 protein [Umezawaea sp. Da 62-37]